MQVTKSLLAVGLIQVATGIAVPQTQANSHPVVQAPQLDRRLKATWVSSQKANTKWQPSNLNDTTRTELSTSSAHLNARDEAKPQEPKVTDSRCTFYDRFNEMTPCDHFVVAFGNADEFHPDPKFIEFEGDGWTETYYLDCGPNRDGNEWNEFDSDWVPGLEIHPGNTCFVKPGGDEFDNTWIHMNGLFINVADHNLCPPRDPWGKGRRCRIAWADVKPPPSFNGITCTKNSAAGAI